MTLTKELMEFLQILRGRDDSVGTWSSDGREMKGFSYNQLADILEEQDRQVEYLAKSIRELKLKISSRSP